MPRPALDLVSLERLALFYVGRYATTRAKLGAYLARKVKDREWAGEGPPPIDRVVQRIADLGYIDDQAYASARAAALGRRGFGARRVDQDLYAAGISPDDGADARQQAQDRAWESALRYAERKRIGPFATTEPDRAASQKALGAMLRAGHPIDIARKIVVSAQGIVPNPDDM